MEPVNLKARS